VRLFTDTSAFIAIEDTDDENHTLALEYREKIQHGETPFIRLYTSNYILDESLTLLRMKCGHEVAVAFRETIEASKLINILWVDEATEKIAWEIFKKNRDKDFSFTDCTSFALMKREAIHTAFTFDKHFSQYGFKVVP
jgi:hypothetical protein